MNFNDVTKRIGEALMVLLKRNWSCPIYAVAITRNGSMIGYKYDFDGKQEGLNCKVLAEWKHPSDIIMLPVNVMLTDSRGEVATIVISG